MLGASAPPIATILQSSVGLALRWRASRDLAEPWATYVKTEDAYAWQAAKPALDDLKALFLIAVSKNASLAVKYPALAAYCNAAKHTAEQALATRKKNAKTKATRSSGGRGFVRVPATAAPNAAPAKGVSNA